MLCKWFSSAPLSQISVKAHAFDLNQLMGVNTNQSLEPEEASCLLCSFTDVCSPLLSTHTNMFVWVLFD